MRTPPPPPTPPAGELEKVIFDELMAARSENRAVSRHMLSQKLHEAKGVHPKDAFAVVEIYCEESAPSTPEYLSSEFMVPYLKMSAFLFAAISIMIIAYSTAEVRQGRPPWGWGILVGGVFLGFSASGWIKSLFREKTGTEQIQVSKP